MIRVVINCRLATIDGCVILIESEIESEKTKGSRERPPALHFGIIILTNELADKKLVGIRWFSLDSLRKAE